MLGSVEENQFYCMDNLELLSQIPDNSIDLIYCDILYGTGKKFNDFDDIKANKAVVDTFYKQRILEMRRVLKPTGSIYLQMDTRINHWMRLLMDDAFGYGNFRNEIVWWYKRWSKAGKYYQKMHDVILFYTKTDDYTFNPQMQSYSKEAAIETTVRVKIDGKLQRLKDENGNYVQREGENKGVARHDVWDIRHIQPTSKERVNYDTQKPLELMELIIKASSNENDIVADFFCGSGSCLVSAKSLNRKYIGCDINSNAISKAKNRIK